MKSNSNQNIDQNKIKAISMILEVMYRTKGKDWDPESDVNFIKFLEENGLLEPFKLNFGK